MRPRSLPLLRLGLQLTLGDKRLFVQRAAYADVMRILLYVALGLAGLSFALSLAMGPACVAERDAAAAGPSPVDAQGHGLERSSVEHALGSRSRWRDEKDGGEEDERSYLRWAREPAHKPRSEADSESGWSDEL